MAVGARCAFAARGGSAGIDGISYLDVAHAYLRHDWSSAVNSYWGPLYSWLLALAMWVTRASEAKELALARLVNFAIFVCALYSFGFCWRGLARRTLARADGANSIPGIFPQGWTIVGYSLFVSASAWYIGSLTPDLTVAAIVFAAVSILLQLEDGSKHAVAAYAGWGALLALGYYAKVILFYFGMYLLFAMMIRHFRTKSYVRPIAALLTFWVLIAPFSILLSRSLGRFTIGETGRLAYAWLTSAPETKTWMNGLPNAAPMPFYPGPMLRTRPMVFQTPHIPGITYAPWYNPPKFDVRSRAHFSLREQLKRVASNLKPVYAVVTQSESAFLLALFILAMFSPLNFLRGLGRSWFYFLPTLAIVVMYVLVFMTWRYMLAFSPLLWGVALSAVAVPVQLRSAVRPVLQAAILVFALTTVPGLVHFLVGQNHEVGREMAIASSLTSAGIERGDLVASIGQGQDATWAHMAGVSIAAEVWTIDGTGFWNSSVSEQDGIVEQILQTGAKAIVWRRDSPQLCPSPWREIPNFAGCLRTP